MTIAPGQPDALMGAVETVREMRKAGNRLPCYILVRGGIYELTSTCELTGDAARDLVFMPYRTIDLQGRPYEGGRDPIEVELPSLAPTATAERVRIVGGKRIHEWKRVTEESVLSQLPEAARSAVIGCDLKALGIRDFGTLKRRGFGLGGQTAALELFFQDERMTLARWPNGDWVRIADVPAGSDSGRFSYNGDRPERWVHAKDVWLHGYWTWDWAESYERVESIRPDTKEIVTVAPHGVYGYKRGARYYALNLLEELDSPGEYFVDREAGMLYFWPPSPVDEAEAWVSVLEGPMISITKAAGVSFEGLSFECTRGPGIVVSDSEKVSIRDCTFANLGTFAVSISGGSQCAVRNCTAYHLGEGGISISGGDRMTLTAGGHTVEDNHIHHFSQTVRTYTPAISVGGVGNRVAHNLLHDSPHMAIGLSGNDHVIEFNDVHHVCMETHDAGPFYMGRDWTQRGTVIRYNFFHEVGHGDVQAIYLDDWTSGITVYGNMVHGARRGVLIGGGRDNVVENNIFVKCGDAVHIDQRGIGWAKNYFDGTTNTLFERLEAVHGTQPPYTTRYPELATLLSEDPALAKNNKVERNINFDGGWLSLHDGLREDTPYLTIRDNWTEGDPGFVDPANLNFRLREDAPALAIGFKLIPVDEIGIRR
jgi:hypothetical protein